MNISVKKIIVILGEMDPCFTNGKIELLFNGIKVNSVNTTGAGDCFIGALVVTIASDFSIEDAAKLEIHASALSLTKYGAQSSSPNFNEVEKFMNI